MNPMLMEDILDDLFKKLTIEDLKNCRSVCKLWDSRASARLKKEWKDLKIINLFSEYGTQSFNRALSESKDKKIFSSFRGSVNILSNLGSKFMSEHQPKQLDLRISSHDGDTKLDDMIDILKLSSKYLVQIIIDDPINYRRIVGLKNDKDKNLNDFTFMNLETIKYNLIQSPHNAHICEQVINIIKEIVENSPKLQSIENHGINVTICSPKIMASEMLQKLTKLTICFYKYSSVHFENYQDCQDLIIMQNQGLKLKYLNIGYNVNDDGEGEEIEKSRIQADLWAIEKFLQGQSGSLETLKIKVKYDYQIKLPAVFSKLKKLIMEIFHRSFKTQINLSIQFPQLEAIFLNIYCRKIVKWNKLFCGEGLKVHTIELCNARSISDGEYRELEILFPHVVNLQISHPKKNSLKYEGFGNFWSKSLKSLSIVTLQNHSGAFAFDLKFFKMFNGLQRINFINQRATVVKDSAYWKADFELLKCFKDLKFIKLDKLLVNQSDLAELRKKYIVDYIPGKLWNYAALRLGINLQKNFPRE